MPGPSASMLSVVCETPGLLLAQQRALPVCAPGEVLVRVRRVGVCGTDLHIFGGISRIFSLQPNFITKFTTELSKNIHPNPANRSGLDELFANYTRLLGDENDWSFVNKMSRDKMPQLFSILGE